MASCQRLWPVPGSSPSGLNGSTSITCSSGIALLLQAYAAFPFSISCSYKAGSGAICLQQRFEAPELALYQLFEQCSTTGCRLNLQTPAPYEKYANRTRKRNPRRRVYRGPMTTLGPLYHLQHYYRLNL